MASIRGAALAAVFWASVRRPASEGSSRFGKVMTGASIGSMTVDFAASTSARFAALPTISCCSFAAET